MVAGGGPAGFMAAIAAAEAGQRRVLVLESTPEPLGKVLISGGGRCNVTHACWDPRELVGFYPRGGKALRGPFSRFAAGDAVSWFDDHGLTLVEEADGRMFPQANRSTAVIQCLRQAAERAGVTLRSSEALQQAGQGPAGGFELTLRSGTQLSADRLVLVLFVSSFAHLKLLLKIPPSKYVPFTKAFVTAPLGFIVIAVVSQPDNHEPAWTPY